MTDKKPKVEVAPLGSIQAGDFVYSPNGQWVPVVESFEEHIPAEMFEVEIDNNIKVLASGNHLWYVTTDEDRESFSTYYNAARRLMKVIPNTVFTDMETVIKDDIFRTISLDDLVDILGVRSHPDCNSVLSRLLDSVGPVTEDMIVLKDVLDSSDSVSRKVRTYDARQVFSQLINIRNNKRKKVIVGRVYTTKELFERDLGKLMLPEIQFSEGENNG